MLDTGNISTGSHPNTMHKLCVFLFIQLGILKAILFPRDSPSRSSKSLDGVWKFKLSPKLDQEAGFRDSWFNEPLSNLDDVHEMPVPASYNDITTNSTIRDYVGWAWYDTQFYVYQGWQEDRVMLRMGSVHYTAMVYLNGEFVTEHSGGHLPFEADVSDLLMFSAKNRLTVAVNNTLTRFTVPQGETLWRTENEGYPPGYSTLEYNFDFFNYAGIHRPVVLYTTPKDLFINDITTNTAVHEDLSATFNFQVKYFLKNQKKENIQCNIQLLDGPEEEVVDEAFSCSGNIDLQSPKLWWPYLMSENPGHMYTFRVSVYSVEHGMDEYSLPVGLRQVSWDTSSFKINNRPFYFRGFGRHEDSNIRGKGLDLPLFARDYDLIKWMGANSYRTSHYPYADELMDFADRNGIVIIDECPGVALDHFEPQLLDHHMQVMTELVQRDKNHPSVVMWSVGNEPKSYRNQSGEYFKRVADHTRDLDTSRPVTLVCNAQWDQDHASQHFDVIAINRYFAWYSDTGHTELIKEKLFSDLSHWRNARGKPVMLTEYGADTVAGLHMEPSMVFTEEYQVDLMRETFKAFDAARAEGWFIGEHIWNFADFMTKQEPRRVAGNKKGIFTRERQPKMSAHLLRSRYWKLAEEEGVRYPEEKHFILSV